MLRAEQFYRDRPRTEGAERRESSVPMRSMPSSRLRYACSKADAMTSFSRPPLVEATRRSSSTVSTAAGWISSFFMEFVPGEVRVKEDGFCFGRARVPHGVRLRCCGRPPAARIGSAADRWAVNRTCSKPLSASMVNRAVQMAMVCRPHFSALRLVQVRADSWRTSPSACGRGATGSKRFEFMAAMVAAHRLSIHSNAGAQLL
jgi:hypothetical protein